MSNITFVEPRMFLLLIVVGVMAFGVVRLLRWRKKAREEFAGPQAASWPASTLTLRMGLVLIAAVLIVIAAARPSWSYNERIRPSQGAEFVIALDVSQSMTGTDVAPTRLAVAQEELKRLVNAQRGSRIGLVFFAGTAIIRSPLTTDTLALSQLIDRAGREGSLTRAGSDFGAALDLADIILSSGEETAGKAVIVVSDGEDHANTFIEKASGLREKGIGVFAAGVGTARGSQLFDIDPRNQPRLKVDAGGQPVVSRLDQAKLESMAEAGGGRYVQIESGSNVLLSLRDDLARLNQTTFGELTERIPNERYQAFVVAALILLVEAWALPAGLLLPGAARLRRVKPHPGLALVVFALFLGACGTTDSLRSENAAANALFNSGDFEGALRAYETLLAARPDVPEISFNTGNALHRLGNYERAVTETQRSLPPTQAKIGAATYYSLGNHYLAQDLLREAYEAYKNALLIDPNDADAKYNLEVTLARFNQMQPGDNQQVPGVPQPGQPDAPGQPETPTESPTGEPTPEGQPGEPQNGQPPPPGSQGAPEMPSTTPPPPELLGGESQRALQEALRGLDENVSFEEAQRILDLLREQQQRQLSLPQGAPSGPDY